MQRRNSIENFAKLPKVLCEKFERAKPCRFRGYKFCKTIYSNFSIKMRRFVKAIGIACLLVGILIILASIPSITGFAIFEDAPLLEEGWIFGLVILIIGIVIIFSSQEATIDVYVSGRGRTKEEDYRIKNSGLSSKYDDLNLKEFKNAVDEIREIKDEKDREDLLRMARDDCIPGLERIVKGGGKKGEVAEEFLKVLQPNYEKKEKKEDYRLKKEEREEIKGVFRSFSGGVDSEQRRILEKYGLVIEGRNKDIKLSYPGTTCIKSLPDSKKGDTGLGIIYATRIINTIEEGRKELAERAKKEAEKAKEEADKKSKKKE